MSGKCRPSLRAKTLCNVERCNLSQTDKDCIKAVFDKFEEQQAEIERLTEENQEVYSNWKKLKQSYDVLAVEAKGEFNILIAEREVAKQEVDRLSVMVIKLQKQLKAAKAEAVKEFAEKVQAEIKEALESNYKARAEKEKKELNKYLDNLFWNYCTGKIDCLRGIEDFIYNLAKETVGDNNG